MALSKACLCYIAKLSEADIPKKLEGKVLLLSGSPKNIIEEIKSGGFSNIYLDGGRLIQSFIKEGLVNEITVSTIPVLIGTGKPLFGDLKRDVKLKLINSKPFKASSILQSHYRVCH